MAFNNLAENAERLSRRIQESLQERTRDLTKSGAASYLDAPDLDKGTNLVKLLNSSSEREKLDGMKRIVAVCCRKQNSLVKPYHLASWADDIQESERL